MFLFSKNSAISTKSLEQKLADKPTILDVRESAEFTAGHIPGAINVPLGKVGNYKTKSQSPIYIICQSGVRSKRAVGLLKKKGIEAIQVKGGMSRWQGVVKGGKY